MKHVRSTGKLLPNVIKAYQTKTLSFNLINEAPAVSTEKYDRVARKLIKTIRAVDKNRLIIVDGKNVGGAYR